MGGGFFLTMYKTYVTLYRFVPSQRVMVFMLFWSENGKWILTIILVWSLKQILKARPSFLKGQTT